MSRKALRLYDELGLLPPARVDPVSQYRLYEPAQLEQARLVAWLRRLGMPLAAIRAVSTLPPPLAAAERAAYWSAVEAETAARRELATFLVGYLSGRDTPMSDAYGTLAVRCAGQSDIGLHRADNEDAAYAGARLLAVADGMGGHAALTAYRGSERDLQLRQALPGDRYLLCSDGLHAVADAGSVARVLLTVADPDQAARDLIALAIDGGGPDNITCIVADVVASGTRPRPRPSGRR